MTPVTLTFLTLYTWIVSPESQLCLALSQYEHETEICHALLNGFFNKVNTEETKKLALTCERKENVQADSAFHSCITLRCLKLLENPSPEAWIWADHQQQHLSAIICATKRSREATLKGPGAIAVTVCATELREMIGQPRTVYGLGKVLIASFQLLLGIFLTQLILITSDSRYGNNSLVLGLLTLTLHCLPQSALLGQPQGWSCVLRQTAFGITFVLSCGLGKPIHVLIAFRATWTVLHWLCHSSQQQAWLLPLAVAQVMVCVVWFFITHVSPNRNGRQLFYEDIIHVQFVIYLSTLYFECVSFTLLLRSIQAKLNVLSPSVHMRLVACLQHSRVITKYIIVIKVNMPL